MSHFHLKSESRHSFTFLVFWLQLLCCFSAHQKKKKKVKIIYRSFDASCSVFYKHKELEYLGGRTELLARIVAPLSEITFANLDRPKDTLNMFNALYSRGL